MIKQVGKRNEAHDRGKENQSGKDGKDKIIGQRRRHLESMMPQEIAVCAREGSLNTVEVHSLKIIPSFRAGEYLKDGRLTVTRRWSQSRCFPACFRDEQARSHFFVPEAN